MYVSSLFIIRVFISKYLKKIEDFPSKSSHRLKNNFIYKEKCIANNRENYLIFLQKINLFLLFIFKIFRYFKVFRY